MTSLAVCAFMLMLPLIPRAALVPRARIQHPHSAGVKEEIERVPCFEDGSHSTQAKMF